MVSYQQVNAWDNPYFAWCKAARGKRGRPTVACFEYHMEDNRVAPQQDLAART